MYEPTEDPNDGFEVKTRVSFLQCCCGFEEGARYG